MASKDETKLGDRDEHDTQVTTYPHGTLVFLLFFPNLAR